ncbi:MAG: PepSY domain-containing protein [Gammaproteobacteria bacterium]
MTQRHKSRARLLRSLYMWHRYMGLAASLFVILLTITGLALNHTEELGLDSSSVHSDILLDWYGIHAPDISKSYRAGIHRVTEVGDSIYWNTLKIPGLATPLIGVVETTDLIIVGVEDRLLLFTAQGELVEQLGSAAGVPSGMQAIGLTADGKLAIRTPQGYYRVDADFIDWHKTDSVAAIWTQSDQPSPQFEQALKASWRGTGLPLERVVLDLHSGRILGSRGVYLVDAAAVLFLLLAVTGVWLWGKRRTSARRHCVNR